MLKDSNSFFSFRVIFLLFFLSLCIYRYKMEDVDIYRGQCFHLFCATHNIAGVAVAGVVVPDEVRKRKSSLL